MEKEMKFEKLQGRDFIIIGVFGLLFGIVEIGSAVVTAFSAIGWLFSMVVAAIPCGIIYMYILAKVPKKWAIATAIILCSLIYFFIGTFGIWTPIFGILGGISADLIARTGGYKKFINNAIGFICCITLQWFGFMQPILLTTDQYIETALSSGMTLDYIQPMVDFITGSGFVIALIATAFSALLGAFIGKSVLKKHFEKAGVL